MTAGKLLGLRWHDVDYPNRRVWVRGSIGLGRDEDGNLPGRSRQGPEDAQERPGNRAASDLVADELEAHPEVVRLPSTGRLRLREPKPGRRSTGGT